MSQGSAAAVICVYGSGQVVVAHVKWLRLLMAVVLVVVKVVVKVRLR